MKLIILIALLLTPLLTIFAIENDKKFPLYASIKSDEVNVRAGPGTQYPILWIFKKEGWPIKVLAQYQSWYKIQDTEGEEGWIYKNLISKKHTALVKTGDPLIMYKTTESSNPIARFAAGVVLKVEKCIQYLCKVKYNKNIGWVDKSRLLMVK